MDNKIQKRKILPDKWKYLVKAEDKPTRKLAQKLKDKNRKVMFNYNNKLGKHTHTKEVKKKLVNQ